MIRRYAYWLRALLMLVDGLLAVGLLVVLSVLRFGADWAVHWRLVIPEPVGLRRALRGRAGWRSSPSTASIGRGPAGPSAPRRRTWRAPRVVMALLVARGPLLLQAPRRQPPLPALPLPDPVRRSPWRRGPRSGSASAGCASAATTPGSCSSSAPARAARPSPPSWRSTAELGLQRRWASWTTRTPSTSRPAGLAPWPPRGPPDDPPRARGGRGRDLPPVQPVEPGRRDRPDLRGGGQDRPRPDGRPRPCLRRRARWRTSTARPSSRSSRARTERSRLAAQAARRPGRRRARPRPPEPALRRRRDRDPRARTAGPVFFRQTPRRPARPPVPMSSSSGRWCADAEARSREVAGRTTRSTAAPSRSTATRASRGSGAFLRRTSLDELPQLWNVLRGRDEPGGPAAAARRDEVAGYDVWHRRRLSMKPGITGLWQVRGPPRAGLRPLGLRRPRVHRPLVALAGRQDPGPDDPGRPGGTMTAKKALITGITGQDGSYLAELLLDKGYEVHGLIRRSSSFNTGRIDHLYRDPHEADDAPLPPLRRPDRRVVADRHAATRSSPTRSTTSARRATSGSASRCRSSPPRPPAMGTLRLLEAVRARRLADPLLPGRQQRDVRQGRSRRPQTRDDAVPPAQPVRRRQGLRPLDDGPLPRGLRPLRLQRHPLQPRVAAPRRDVRHAQDHARRRRDRRRAQEHKLYLGNLDARRDWGYAPEYVEAMWLMLQQAEPDDYVIATGETHTRPRVRARWPSRSSASTGSDYVEIDERYLRPTEVDELLRRRVARPRECSAGGRGRRSTSWSGSCSRRTCARPALDPALRHLQPRRPRRP